MARTGTAPGTVEALYEELACERAGRARATLAQEPSVERMLANGAAALEDAAGALLEARKRFQGLESPLSEMFDVEAGVLVAVAAGFEEAADVSRTHERHDEPGEAQRWLR
jgi:hypothetical protein